MPEGLINFVLGYRSAALQVMGHPHIDAVSLSGSQVAGYSAQDFCARRHVPLQDELGGNNAWIIWHDCDLEEAAVKVAKSAFGSAGQRCTADRRAIVRASCYARFVQLLEQAQCGILKDFQVKIRGYRVNIAEIEFALKAFAGIKEATVLRQEGKAGEKELVAYVVADRTIDPVAVRRWLRERLPKYMVPLQYVRLEVLLVAPNGKVDRVALPALSDSQFVAAESRNVFVGSPTERRLAEIWKDLLGIDRVGLEAKLLA